MITSRTIIVLLTFAAVAVLNAQTITVVDQNTDRPLEGVSITGADANAPVLTDVRGRASIASLAGSDSLHLHLLGYGPNTVAFGDLAKSENRIVLTAAAFPLNEVVISANHWEQEADRVPDQITVIKPRDIVFNNPGTAADMLQQTGEVFMQKSQLGGGSPMLRGFAANRVLIVVDGVRMNNAIYRAGNLQNVLSADPYVLERAEVIHGPGAMTYGSDAIGGVMDFHLLSPKFSADSTLLFRGGAAARYGSAASEYGGHLDLGLGGRKLAFVGSASFTRFGDLRMGTQGPDDYLRPWYSEVINGADSMVINSDPELQVGSAYDNMNFMGKLAYRPVASLEIGANFYYSTTSDVPRYDRLIELRNGAPRSAEWYYGPQNWLMGSLRIQHQAKRGPWSTARLTVAYQDYEESRNDRNFGNSRLRTQAEHVSGIWGNLDLEKDLGSSTQLLYGAEFVTNDVGSTGQRVDQENGEFEVINSRYPDGSSWNTGSVYVGAMRDFNDRLTLSAGARFNWSALECVFDTSLFPYPATATSLSNNALTGNLGLAYRPGTAWKFSLDLSTGFRSPNIDDIGKVFDSEPGAVIVPNPQLAPEYAYTAEVGIEKVIADRVRLRANGYYILLDNAMVRRPYELNGQDSIMYDGELSRVDAIQNAAQATVLGFLIAVDAKLGLGIGLDARYNWQDGVEQDDDNIIDVPLRHCPPAFGSAGLSWERKKIRLRLYADFSAGFTFDDLAPSEQAKTPIYALDDNGDPYAPSWYTLNFKGSYQIMKALQVTAGVENITDQRYRPYSSGITAPGRNFLLALRASF
ncbi:MAG: TonB-dependent receptor [Flavobacteriales bacterium]|nr:TonB-dependent receptor [Flavobacteriales bacterium]